MEVTKLICLGDSITWGFPYGPDYSWIGLAAGTLGWPMLNRGINGDTAADLLQRMHRDILSEKPSHAMIMVGTNDASMNIPLKRFRDRIEKILCAALEEGVSPIIGLPIPADEQWLEYTLQKYRHWLTTHCKTANVPIVDFAPAMLLPGGSLNRECYLDGVHPSKTGYQAMAKVFIDFCQLL